MSAESTAIVPIDCYSIPIQYCNSETTNSWCKWHTTYDICVPNYDCSVFLKPTDGSSPSIAFYGIICGVFCYVVYYHIATKLIANKLGLLSHLDKFKKEKCIIYVSEIIYTLITLFFICYHGTISIMWNPSSFEHLSPSDLKNHITFFVMSLLLLSFAYALELIVQGNKMRLSLQMHHIVFFVLATLITLSMDERKDIPSLRVCFPLILYASTESNIFFQLLLYRISPHKYLIFHYASTAFYIGTRLVIVIFMIVAYIDFYNTEFVLQQVPSSRSDDLHPLRPSVGRRRRRSDLGPRRRRG
eukprot:78918_1